MREAECSPASLLAIFFIPFQHVGIPWCIAMQSPGGKHQSILWCWGGALGGEGECCVLGSGHSEAEPISGGSLSVWPPPAPRIYQGRNEAQAMEVGDGGAAGCGDSWSKVKQVWKQGANGKHCAC